MVFPKMFFHILLATLATICHAHDAGHFYREKGVENDDLSLLMQTSRAVPVFEPLSQVVTRNHATVAGTKEGLGGRASPGARQQNLAVGLQQSVKQVMVLHFMSYLHSYFVMGLALGIIAFVLLLVIVRNCLGSTIKADEILKQSPAPSPEELPTLALLALVLPEAFHGYTSATFMPYVLVKQGPEMTGSSATFIGTTKAVFAVSVAFMPAMSVVSDWFIFRSSYVAGRCNSLIIGSLLTAAGLYACVICTEEHQVLFYYMAVFLMRLGTDLFNIVNDALLVDLIPEKQYAAASGMKGAMYFLGTALSFLMLLGEIHYKSLYYHYFVGVFLLVLPGTLVVAKYKPLRQSGSLDNMQKQTIWASLWGAYHGPLTMKTYFPRVALSIFLFHVGAAPCFMFLLCFQDLVPISDENALRHNWCLSSFLSLLGAAVFSTLFALEPRQRVEEEAKEATMDHHVTLLRRWAWACAMVLALTPFPGLCGYTLSKIQLYVISILFMACYAVAKAYYHQLSWLSLPNGMSSANCMAFFIACSVSGVGVGSLISGFILDRWAKDDHSYLLPGYFAIICFSVFSCFAGIAALRWDRSQEA